MEGGNESREPNAKCALGARESVESCAAYPNPVPTLSSPYPCLPLILWDVLSLAACFPGSVRVGLRSGIPPKAH